MAKPRGGLTKWFKEDWVDISRPKKGGGFEKCGRTKSGSKKYPKCLPAAKAARLTPAQSKYDIRLNSGAVNPPGMPTNVSTFAKRKRRARKKG